MQKNSHARSNALVSFSESLRVARGALKLGDTVTAQIALEDLRESESNHLRIRIFDIDCALAQGRVNDASSCG